MSITKPRNHIEGDLFDSSRNEAPVPAQSHGQESALGTSLMQLSPASGLVLSTHTSIGKVQENLLGVEIPSASTSSTSSPVMINHSDAEPALPPLPVTVTPPPTSASASPLLGNVTVANTVALSDGRGHTHVVDVSDLDPDAVKELVCEKDHKYIATPNAEVARELKKRFNAPNLDKNYITLYTITNFTNQYGRSMYRVEPRGTAAPAASGFEAAESLALAQSSHKSMGSNKPDPSAVADRLGTQQQSPRGAGKMKTRSSILSFKPNFNKSSGGNMGSHSNTYASGSGSSYYASTSGSSSGALYVNEIGVLNVPGGDAATRNRLRKSRSNSDFAAVPLPHTIGGLGSTGLKMPSHSSPSGAVDVQALGKRQHSHTISGAEAFAHVQGHGQSYAHTTSQGLVPILGPVVSITSNNLIGVAQAPQPSHAFPVYSNEHGPISAAVPPPPLDTLGAILQGTHLYAGPIVVAGRSRYASNISGIATNGYGSPPMLSPDVSTAGASASSVAFSVFGDENASMSGAQVNPFGPGVLFDTPSILQQAAGAGSDDAASLAPTESESGSRDGEEQGLDLDLGSEDGDIHDHDHESDLDHMLRRRSSIAPTEPDGDGDGENTPDGPFLMRAGHVLRVKESFESGMTARAGDHGRLRPKRSVYGLGLASVPSSGSGIVTTGGAGDDISEGSEGEGQGTGSASGRKTTPLQIVTLQGAPPGEVPERQGKASKAERASRRTTPDMVKEEESRPSPSLQQLIGPVDVFLAATATPPNGHTPTIDDPGATVTEALETADVASFADEGSADLTLVDSADVQQSEPTPTAPETDAEAAKTPQTTFATLEELAAMGALVIVQGAPRQPSNAQHTLSEATRACVGAWGTWSTETFDILQTSRGLPKLNDALHKQDTVLSISLESEATALPKNDPRFVIWGELEPGKAAGIRSSASPSASASGLGTTLVHSDSTSRLRSNSASTQVSVAPSHVSSTLSHTSDPSRNKVMVAASIERWVAQLTSELNNDELLVFFLTYRIYIDGPALAELLITRFHWTLESTACEEAIRKFVRLRTYVALKYWIEKFFTVDFVPNQALRKVVTQWLNALKRDPITDVQKDVKTMVRNLVKAIKAARNEWERDHPSRVRRSTARPSSSRDAPGDESDLEEPDFLADAGSAVDEAPAFQHTVFKQGPREATYAIPVTRVAPGAHLPPGVTVVPSMASADALTATFATSTNMPTNALHRALTSTFSRMGRWRRALSSRPPSPTHITQVARVSAFDLDVDADLPPGEKRAAPVTRVLAPVQVDFQPTLDQSQLPSPVSPPPVPPKDTSLMGVIAAAEHPPLEPLAETAEEEDVPPNESSIVEVTTSVATDEDDVPEPVVVPSDGGASIEDRADTETLLDSEPEPKPAPTVTQPSRREPTGTRFDDAPSYRSSVASSRFSYQSDASDDEYYGSPPPGLAPVASTSSTQPAWRSRFGNDYDLSDFSDSDDENHGSGSRGLGKKKLVQPKRRMPKRGEFELVRHSDSMSSFSGPSRSSIISSGSISESQPEDAPLGVVQQWQMNALVDDISDDEGMGDRDSALKKIEGQIRLEPDRQKEKEEKLQRWINSIKHRNATGDYDLSELPRFPIDDDEDEEEGQLAADAAAPVLDQQDRAGEPELTVPIMEHTSEATTPVAKVPPPLVTPSTAGSSSGNLVHDAVPPEILQSRVNLPGTMPPDHHSKAPPTTSPRLTRAPLPSRASHHRSFVLDYPSMVLAQHFAMIDRELFLAVKFEELTDTELLPSTQDSNFLDWAQFLRDRYTAKAEGRYGTITMSLVAVRARFNLVAGFVVSQILLASPHERASTFSKLLRVAWKSQQINSFGTLVAVMAGLCSDWVERAMHQHRHQLPASDTRLMIALKKWVTSEGDFMYINNEVHSLEEKAKATATTAARPHAGSVASTTSDGVGAGKRSVTDVPAQPVGGVPFIGVYLSQMRHISELPDTIDPTAPRERVARGTQPAHPEVFAALPPLPKSMPLNVLVNIQKQRRIAGVVQALVSGQHLAARVQYAVDRKVYQRCLRLRALDYDSLRNAMDLQGM